MDVKAKRLSEEQIIMQRCKESCYKPKCIKCAYSVLEYGIHDLTVGELKYSKKDYGQKQSKHSMGICTYKCNACNYMLINDKITKQIRERIAAIER